MFVCLVTHTRTDRALTFSNHNNARHSEVFEMFDEKMRLTRDQVKEHSTERGVNNERKRGEVIYEPILMA